MRRAAVFIGVDRAGHLPVLADAAAGAERLHREWGFHQRLGPSVLLTDREKPVTADDVQSAITNVLEPGNLDQLVVYFAGHGVNVRMGEYWLLSDAPRKTQAAVNVRGSEHLARYCGVPHVVFVSDACRLAADTINAQNVTGTDIFPNEQHSETELPVDLFYACALGKPSHEARDVNETSGGYKALYTHLLCAALCFEEPDAVEWVVEDGQSVGYVRPRRLRDFMKDALPDRVRSLRLKTPIAQTPDAHISSDPGAWLSRFEGSALAGVERAPRFNIRPDPAAEAIFPRGLESFGRPVNIRAWVSAAIANPGAIAAYLGVSAAPRPLALQATCGFEIQGARLRHAFGQGARLERLLGEPNLIRCDASNGPSGLALFVLEDGRGVTLPVVPDFIATLTFVDGELIDITYEPSAGSLRTYEFYGRKEQLRTLRKVISEATLLGEFRLEGDEASTLARHMQSMKSLDPTLGLYASYAYHDLHRPYLLREIEAFMREDLGGSFFDIAMHAGRLDGGGSRDMPPVFGIGPLLSQGWAYLRARGIRLPPGCEDLDTMLADSLWTMFTPEGVYRLRSTIFQGAEPWQVG
jgi:hypothetical protein